MRFRGGTQWLLELRGRGRKQQLRDILLYLHSKHNVLTYKLQINKNSLVPAIKIVKSDLKKATIYILYKIKKASVVHVKDY